MGNQIHPIFLEPEVHSAIFISANFIGASFLRFYLGGWPLSIFWSIIYFGFATIINHALSSGSSYLPMKNLNGKTVIITGAATGIGRVCAIRLARLGARVIVGIRGRERAEKIAKEMIDESNGGTVIGFEFDLSNSKIIKEFTEKIDRVDILINNAGSLKDSFDITIDGIETQFQTNYLGHFYLTKLLLSKLEKDGRIVNVSSLVHHVTQPADLDYSFSRLKSNYNTMKAYGFSKIAQIYHANELTRRYNVKAYSLHPGTIVKTELNKHRNWFALNFLQIFSIFGKNLEQGAMTTLFCALSDDAQPGCFHSDCHVRRPSSLALDQRRSEECWNETERMISKKF